jgi:DNA-binding NarL/FixJ family response regulator
MMEKYRILLSGPTISHNRNLIENLATYFTVIENKYDDEIESKIENYHISLLILELSNKTKSEIDLIERIKSHFPYIKIILINGERDQRFMARAIGVGVTDIYRRPCNIPLLVERVHTLLYLMYKV